MTVKLPSATAAKAAAKALRIQMAEEGTQIGASKALELIAHRLGFRDWNGLSAAIAKALPTRLSVGERVSGQYLGHPFEATIVSAQEVQPAWWQLELHLDDAVDVVTSLQFSNFRRRIRGRIGPKGHSQERTSDGIPHLTVEL